MSDRGRPRVEYFDNAASVKNVALLFRVNLQASIALNLTVAPYTSGPLVAEESTKTTRHFQGNALLFGLWRLYYALCVYTTLPNVINF